VEFQTKRANPEVNVELRKRGEKWLTRFAVFFCKPEQRPQNLQQALTALSTVGIPGSYL
jgi:hypothetical protein